jgi:predicted TIM-barrel fold metal-dependent hydrolase
MSAGNATAKKMPVSGVGMESTPLRGVDCHAHVMHRDAPLAPDRHSAPKRDCSVDEFLALLDAHGLSHGVLTAPSFYGTDNSLLVDALTRAAGRLRGTAIVAPEVSPDALAALDACGVVGIRLNWFRRDALSDVGSEAYARLLDEVRALDWQVEIYLEGPKLARVLPRLREHGARVVVDHFGGPDPARGVDCDGFQAVLAGVRAGDTFVKLSASYRQGGVDCQRYVDALLDAGGPQQLVWASDWPFVGHEERVSYGACLDELSRWVPDTATRQIILAATPAKLFAFDQALPAQPALDKEAS